MVLAEFTTATLVSWVLVGLVVGLILGWLLRPWLVADRQQQVYDEKLAVSNAGRIAAETDLATATEDLDDARGELEAASAQVARLGADMGTATARITELESSLETVTLDKDVELERLSDEAKKIAELEAVIEKQTGRIADLDAALISASSQETAEGTRIVELEEQVAASAAWLADRDARITSLESQLASAETVLAAEIETEVEADAEVEALEAVIDKETALLRVAEIALRTRGAAAAVDDDLKRVHGIGPAIEGLLKGMDITSFRQIANFAPDDIAYVAAALESFPDRIERDNWMASAAELHEEHYDEPA